MPFGEAHIARVNTGHYICFGFGRREKKRERKGETANTARSLNLSESFPKTHNVQLLKSIAHISRF